MKTTAEIDWQVFLHALEIAKENAPDNGLPSRWCLALGYFRDSKCREPRFDVGRAWKHALATEVK
jgi:hypothetical protein